MAFLKSWFLLDKQWERGEYGRISPTSGTLALHRCKCPSLYQPHHRPPSQTTSLPTLMHSSKGGSRPGRVRYHRVWSCWPMCQENSVLEEGIFYWHQNKSDTMTGLFRSAGGPPEVLQSASCPHDRPRWGRLRRTGLKNNTNIRKILN